MFFYETPNYELANKSYEEKMEILDFPYIDIFIFINESTEDESTILFFDGTMHILAKSFLYPHRICENFYYLGDDDNSELFDFIVDKECDYIYYYDQNFTLFSRNPSIFERIESRTHDDYFLFEINRTRL